VGYDVIVVGARAAGAPTAMLLARRGCRVLLVDRTRYPSDTLSTHNLISPGCELLDQWGLLDGLVATGCPGSTKIVAHTPAGDFESPLRNRSHNYAPRRKILDPFLARAAVDAGAELREGVSVRDLLVDDGRVTGVVLRADDGVEH